MSRLFYEQNQREKEAAEYPRMGFNARNQHTDAMRYLEKVAKLVPSEIIAGYLTVIGFVPLVKVPDAHPWIYGFLFVLCFTLTPLYLNAQAERDRPKRMHLILSSLAFVVWAYVVSGNEVVPRFHDPALASILMVTFSLISGVIPLKS
jgi:hypothetical protein